MIPYYELTISFEEAVIEIQHVFEKYYSNALTDVYFNSQETLGNLPILRELLNKLKIYNPYFMVVIIDSGKRFPPHVHQMPYSPWNLLIPVKNTKNSFTQFFKRIYLPNKSIEYNDVGEEVVCETYDIELCEVTHEIEVIRPVLINVGVLHGVLNPLENNGVRHILSIVITNPNYNPLEDANDYII